MVSVMFDCCFLWRQLTARLPYITYKHTGSSNNFIILLHIRMRLYKQTLSVMFISHFNLSISELAQLTLSQEAAQCNGVQSPYHKYTNTYTIIMIVKYFNQ